MTYRTNELDAACPLPLWDEVAPQNYPHGILVQFKTEYGTSKWLTISPQEFKDMAEILCRES